MRKDLDVIRERHVLREVREELAGHTQGQWGWASTFRPSAAKPTRVVTEDELTALLGPRPGTSDGGF